jgi:hypothetical protein
MAIVRIRAIANIGVPCEDRCIVAHELIGLIFLRYSEHTHNQAKAEICIAKQRFRRTAASTTQLSATYTLWLVVRFESVVESDSAARC